MAGLGRSPQTGFSGSAKCCGAALGEKGSFLPFAALRTNDRNSDLASPCWIKCCLTAHPSTMLPLLMRWPFDSLLLRHFLWGTLMEYGCFNSP